jgi:hypothetical protein
VWLRSIARRAIASRPSELPVDDQWATRDGPGCDAAGVLRRLPLSTEEGGPVAFEPPSFEKDVKPLFREQDRKAMAFVFDLWSFDDVSKHAADILRVVATGYMPCDSRWDADRVELFRRWLNEGKAT